jgi:putative spermidine/putrescine transport system ATP-binding protein
MAFIHFENICKSFGQNQVLRGISMDVEKGELITLLGSSGCGKSTMLRCLAGLETVSSGRIYLDGKDITEMSPQKRAIGMVFQQYSLFPNMTVGQNVAFGLQMNKMDKKQIKDKVREVLEIVGLTEKIDQYPKQLSGGQQQRVALARAIVTEPKVLLLDEPLSAIDALLRRSLQIEIRRIQKRLNITTVFVTHDQDEAMVMSDRIYLFNNGLIEQAGDPVDFYTHPQTPFAATFIGHYNIWKAEDFVAAVREPVDAAHVAIRPELVTLSREPVSAPDCYTLEGKIRDDIPHGNVLRYNILCGSLPIQADILFDTSFIFKEDEKVYVTFKKDACLLFH